MLAIRDDNKPKKVAGLSSSGMKYIDLESTLRDNAIQDHLEQIQDIVRLVEDDGEDLVGAIKKSGLSLFVVAAWADTYSDFSEFLNRVQSVRQVCLHNEISELGKNGSSYRTQDPRMLQVALAIKQFELNNKPVLTLNGHIEGNQETGSPFKIVLNVENAETDIK